MAELQVGKKLKKQLKTNQKQIIMKKNVGNGDRFLRIILGIIGIILALSGSFEGVLKWGLLVVGLVLIVTSSMQICPLYTIFGISTCKVKGKKK